MLHDQDGPATANILDAGVSRFGDTRRRGGYKPGFTRSFGHDKLF